MAVHLIAKVWTDPYFSRQRKAELLVALAIADFARKEDGKAWPSIESLARKARTSVRGAQDACRSLENAGKLRVEAGAGMNGTNAYFLLFTPAADAGGGVQPLQGGGCNEAPVEAAAEPPEQPAAGCTQTVRNQSGSKKNHEEPSSSSSPNTAARDEEEAGFEEFWKIYPRKEGYGDAKAMWVEQACARISGEILESVSSSCRGQNWTKEGGRFIPQPANWLKKCRWKDQASLAISRDIDEWMHVDHEEWVLWLDLYDHKDDPSLIAAFKKDKKHPAWRRYVETFCNEDVTEDFKRSTRDALTF